MDTLTLSVIKEFKQALTLLYGDDLAGLICYGSQVRGEATQNSDIGLSLILKGDIKPSREIDRVLDLLADFNLRYGVLISLIPVAKETWEGHQGHSGPISARRGLKSERSIRPFN
jgi:predicted nucleotidyltransferase